MPVATADLITVTLPVPFTKTWERIPGIAVDGAVLTIDPDVFFFRYENPSWLICDWQRVHDELLPAAESEDLTIEQLVLDFVRANARPTRDPAEVLHIAHQVYAHMYRDEQLQDPGLDFVPDGTLLMLRECATLMALNRVELDGHISNVSPAWMLCAAARVVYDLDQATAEVLDELYHGTWFNESRRRESILAHAALGGRLVHACQGAPNQSGGCIVPFGTDVEVMRRELAGMRLPWIEQTLAPLT
jgi:hypothetical protein